MDALLDEAELDDGEDEDDQHQDDGLGRRAADIIAAESRRETHL